MGIKNNWPCRLWCIGIYFLFAAIPATGQSLVPKSEKAVYAFFMFGGQQADFGSLNPALTTQNYADFSETLPTLGGGGHALFDRFLVGAQGHYLIPETRTGDNGLKNTLSGGLATLDFGFAIVNTKSWIVFPFFSTGGGWLTLKIQEEGSLAFDELLAEPGRSVEINKSGFLFAAGLGADYIIHLRQGYTESDAGFAVGLRIGYQAMAGDRDWQNETLTISGGPNASLDGAFVRIVLGAGGN